MLFRLVEDYIITLAKGKVGIFSLLPMSSRDRNRSRDPYRSIRRTQRPRSVPRRDPRLARGTPVRVEPNRVNRRTRTKRNEAPRTPVNYRAAQSGRESIHTTYGSVERSRQKGKSVKLTAFVILLLIVVGGVGVGIYFGVVPTSAFTGESTPAILITTTRSPVDTPTPDVMVSPITDEEWVRHRGDCGRPLNRPDLSARIVGGTEAVKHSWPWQIGLLK